MTVALLAIGLFATGIGTMVFLRTTLTDNLDASLTQVTSTDITSSLFTIIRSGDELRFTARTGVVPTDYFVALYDAAGNFIISAGGGGAPEPVFPETYPLDKTIPNQLQPFDLASSDGGDPYRAMVAPQEVAGTSALYTQLVALPTVPVSKVVRTFTGIYSLLALVVIVAGALLTRWLVTLTFRSLGQVESTADAIAKGDFGQRLTDIEPTTTEVGRLKTAINAMLGRVDGAISERDSTVRQMRRFIGDASHELRTPLVTVRGYAELYRMGAIQGDDDITQAMVRIEKEAIRMGVLVEDLLALARLDERRDVILAPIDLRPVARDAAMDVRAASPLRPITVIDTTAPGKTDPEPAASAPPGAETAEPAPRRAGPPTAALGIAGATRSLLRRKPRPVPATQATGLGDEPSMVPVDLSIRDDERVALPPVVLGDENRIRQVVANLLGNARRFTPDESPIELRVGVDPVAGMGWIEVADHGDGIPEQIRGQIFQRFWRADTSRARETGGSGLGLSIVASIVEALHGAVSVADSPGGGATFRVAFPLARARSGLDHLNIETQPIPRIGNPRA